MKNIVTEINQRKVRSSDNCMKVSIAESEQERLRIYRLRYQVYVEEMGRQLKSADHKNRLVFDELDARGFLVYAQVEGDIIGTVRLNMATVGEFSPDLVNMFHMDIFQTFDHGQSKQRLGFSSKYVVAPAYRRTQTPYLVVARLYELYRDAEIQFTFAGCNPYMITLYERMGFRRFADNFAIPEYGCMVPLIWLLEDENHLRAVGSPFYRNARRRRNNSAAAQWFAHKFPSVSQFANSRLINEDELWIILEKKLGQSPHLAIPVLAGLTENEAKKFVQIGVIHMYKTGERIIDPGDICHEMNILLAGVLEVNSPVMGAPLNTTCVKPGDLFGRVALWESKHQVVYATAGTKVEFLIISGMAFTAFSRRNPAIAQKIILNIAGGADDAGAGNRSTSH